MMVKTDRRILRSRALISEALLSLLMEKPFHEITIQEVTDRANVARATFYLHFRNKEECLLQILTEGFDALSEKYDNPISESHDDSIGRIEDVFEHTSENRELYLALLNLQHTTVSLVNIQDYIAEKMLTGVPFPDDITPVTKKAIAAFLAGALQNMQIWWLKEQPPISAREAAEMFVRIAESGYL